MIPAVAFSLTMTPLGLGVLENGWKFLHQNPAEVYYLKSDQLSFSIVAGFGSQSFRKFWLSYMVAPKEGNLGGVLSYGRYFMDSGGDVNFLEYTISGGNPASSWGLKVGLEYQSFLGKVYSGLRMSFGIDTLFSNIRFAAAVEDLYVWTDNPSIYISGKYSAALGYFTQNFGVHFGGYSCNFDSYGVYIGGAVSLEWVGFGFRYDYFMDLKDNKSSSQLGFGLFGAFSNMNFGLTFKKSFPEIVEEFPFGGEANDWDLGITLGIIL